MYFSANWITRGFTLVDVICPNEPDALSGRLKDGSLTGIRVGELRMIERIEEFRPELHGLPLCDPSCFQSRHVPVELAGAQQDARSRGLNMLD
ncbi:MAG: hypothetical protein ABSG13_28310 [Bryobacteraceae bacterium]|jgi:hypothetical protein